MPSLPRIITVDPTGSIPQQIRAAFDLMDRLVVQIDVPGAVEAIDELKRGGIDVVIAAWEPGGGMLGWELAAKLKQISPEVSIMLLGDYDDTEMDEEMLLQSPFVYMKRPFDIPLLINVLRAALDGEDIFKAFREPAAVAAPIVNDMGPVPTLNKDRAGEIVSRLRVDLNAMAVLMATRSAEVLTVHGTLMDIKADEITRNVIGAVMTTIELRDIIGGNTNALQFFDGDRYDIFVLSVGLHHFLLIAYEGTRGARELGAVNRFGRRAAEDLIAVIGAPAWFIQRAAPQPEKDKDVRRKTTQSKTATQEITSVSLERASLKTEAAPAKVQEVVESSLPKLDAIAADQFDADALFNLSLDEQSAADLFSLDALEKLDTEDGGKKGTLDWDSAIELGILDN
jgi:DNA-binding response OmpR family regulator